MPTATKNERQKNKKNIASPSNTQEEVIPGEKEIDIAKNKKILEVDEIEPAIVIEEKIEEDPLIAIIEDEEGSAEEITLDNEELNPFGDRWEE